MKRHLSVVAVLLLLVPFILGIRACETGSVDDKVEARTEKMMKEADRQIGMPNVMNFQQKKTMKMVYEETDKENLIGYAYLKADLSGKLIFIGKCIGYGVPFSAQYTNPERYVVNGATLPQPDPNGLFMPTSSSATWLLLIDPATKKPRVVYIEPELVVSPFKLTFGVAE